MRRDYYRSREGTAGQDHFHMSTRYLPDGRIRVTMYEIAADSTGGPLDKTKVDFGSILEVLDMWREIGGALRAEGWELWVSPKKRRKGA